MKTPFGSCCSTRISSELPSKRGARNLCDREAAVVGAVRCGSLKISRWPKGEKRLLPTQWPPGSSESWSNQWSNHLVKHRMRAARSFGSAVSRVLGSGSRVWVSGFGFQLSGFGVRVSGFGVRVSGFGVRVSGFGFRVSGFGFMVQVGVHRGQP